MTNFNQTLSILLTLMMFLGCGGGGGSSAPTPPPVPAPNPTPIPNPGGGGAVPIDTLGLLSGGVGLIGISDLAIGVSVQLDVAVGGTGGFNVAVGGTGGFMGPIDAFGSVIISGETVNTDNAEFNIEGVTGTQADLKQGQEVLVITDAPLSAAEVRYRSNVKGPVTAATIEDAGLGRATLTVLGQTVVTDATTTYSNIDIASITAGALLEVSGVLDANGVINASFIESKASLTEYKVTGTVTNLNASTFSIAALTIDFTSASLTGFPADQISVDDIVEVKAPSTDFTAPDQLIAESAELLPLLRYDDTAEIEVEGLIDAFTSNSAFEVQSQPVITDGNTTFDNGAASGLALGVKVQAQGAIDTSGVLVASKVTIQPTNAVRAEGNLTGIDLTNRSVSLLGVTFTVRDLTRLEDKSSIGVDPLTLEQLSTGERVEVRGYLDEQTLVATRLDREDNRDRARLRGPVTAEDPAAGTITILNVTVTGQTGITTYEDVLDNIIDEATFFNLLEIGDFAKVDWDVFASTSQIADELSIED